MRTVPPLEPGDPPVSDFPKLAQLGITEPAAITGYVINSMNQIDVLRIAQRREKGSFRPTRRSWEFARVQDEGAKKEGEIVLSISPVLKAVKAELDQLLEGKRNKETTVAALRGELRSLEAEVALRIRNIHDALSRLEEL